MTKTDNNFAENQPELFAKAIERGESYGFTGAFLENFAQREVRSMLKQASTGTPTTSAPLVEAWFDGATEPVNPGGHGAWGAAVKVGGEFVFREGGYVGHGPTISNNVSEYAAFIAAVTECLKYPGPVIIRGDSMLVVNQMNGRWGTRGGLYKPYYDRAKALWAQLKPWARLEWISRDFNTVCDGLSKGVLHARGVQFRIQPEASQAAGPVPQPYKPRGSYRQQRDARVGESPDDHAADWKKGQKEHFRQIREANRQRQAAAKRAPAPAIKVGNGDTPYGWTAVPPRVKP